MAFGIEIVKFGVSAVAGFGATKIVSQIIKNHTVVTTNLDKITMSAGSFAIGAMVASAVKRETDDIIDNVADGCHGIMVTAKLKRINAKESTFEDEKLNASLFVKSVVNGDWVPVENYHEKRK